MIRRFSAITVMAALCMTALVALATPAYAQLGSLTGKVVDEAGKPVPDAEVMLDFNGEQNFHFIVKTDKNGSWARAGLIAVGGRWNITAKKGSLTGTMPNVEIALGGAKSLPDIVLRPTGAVTDPKKNEEAKRVLAEANAALAANNYDLAISKLNEASTKVDKCTDCYLRLGDVYSKQSQFDKAEAAYKQALTIDDKSADAYEGLAAMYNTQKKFDDAGNASSKAMELRAASGGGTGGGDAMAEYNAGAILVNQGKMAEAQVQFQKAIQMDPKLAEAHYQLAMTLINQGKVPDAIKEMEAYLALNPTGPNAQQAKDMLPELKKMQ